MLLNFFGQQVADFPVSLVNCFSILSFLLQAEQATNAFGCPQEKLSIVQTATAGKLGPIVLEDVSYLEIMGHFDRERIPERVVHAKGAGAFGYFETTHDITQYCKAVPFAKVGKRTPVAIRFSTVGK